MKELTAYEITYENGEKIQTSMAATVTLEDAQRYYLGKRFDLGAFPVENMQTAINVKRIGGYYGQNQRY